MTSSPTWLNVSRETFTDLQTFAGMLTQWQKIKNLVALDALDDLWERHIWDSAQLVPFLSENSTWVDIGSGAGFPGIVLAVFAKQKKTRLHLVESNQRKAAFLREVGRVLSLPVSVHCIRIDAFFSEFKNYPVILTARALAPMEQLLDWCEAPFLQKSNAFFIKGENVYDELNNCASKWDLNYKIHSSRTHSLGGIVHIQTASRRSLLNRDLSHG
jgi:16S rRNA (guanine527-N7)-methyltransferase